ncbi:MAG: acetate--CoA ligase family protein [Candidatus Nanohaloarchaeota archaeon QJJ-7]|nr:acetate--CoA ligase family protein [Candidatus Nanohaloarchaeota archaeon QJJ-7]
METLSEHEAMQLFQNEGIPVAEHRLATDEDEAVEAAGDIGYPVFLKIDSGEVQHKTDIGAVMTAHDEEEVRKRFSLVRGNVEKAIPGADVEGILVEEKLEGHEMIVGVNRDAEFGPVIMFGLGGIFVEILRDVNFRAVPIEERDARELVEDMESKKLLEGVRGQEPVDKDAIVDVLLKVSDLVESHPIEELDINPLFVNSEGAYAADALVKMR